MAVCAVVLTYNREQLLDECLTAISRQTQACDRILVIDNASTDGTSAMLAERWGGVEVFRLPRNIGASGGFNAGLRIAYQSAADWIWLMDDDVIPEPDALEKLLQARDRLNEEELPFSYVISTARTPDGELTNVPTLDRKRNKLSYEIWPRLLAEGIVPVRRATFVSILLPRETVGRHGLPLAPMFIWGEDTEYTLRITKTAPGYLVGGSRVSHVRAVSGVLDITTETNPTRIEYHYHLRRNRMYIKRKRGRVVLLKHLYYQGQHILRLLLGRQFHKAKIIAAGNLQGLTFNPPIEAADSPFDIEALRVPSRPTASSLAAGVAAAITVAPL